jgi:hypothetical protein
MVVMTTKYLADPSVPTEPQAAPRTVIVTGGSAGIGRAIALRLGREAHIRTGFTTWVAAVGSDGYVATVTPAEAWVGGRPLLISLAEDGTPLAAPRLVTDGDVKGGRYVSGVYDLVAGQGSPAS